MHRCLQCLMIKPSLHQFRGPHPSYWGWKWNKVKTSTNFTWLVRSAQICRSFVISPLYKSFIPLTRLLFHNFLPAFKVLGVKLHHHCRRGRIQVRMADWFFRTFFYSPPPPPPSLSVLYEQLQIYGKGLTIQILLHKISPSHCLPKLNTWKKIFGIICTIFLILDCL